MKYYSQWMSPIGEIVVVTSDIAVEQVILTQWTKIPFDPAGIQRDHAISLEAVAQLQGYFAGFRKQFQLPLSINGSVFQQTVWQALTKIPYGETRTYGEIAKIIDNPQASRAVGQANRANQLPIIIPCHRVIGHNNKLVGYMGDKTDIKQWLLNLEANNR